MMYFGPDGGKPTLCNINPAPTPPLMKFQSVLYFKKTQAFNLEHEKSALGEATHLMSRDEVVRPEVVRPEVVRADVVRSEVARPEVVRPELIRPEVVCPEVLRCEVVRPVVVHPEVVRPAVLRLDSDLNWTRNDDMKLRFASLHFASQRSGRGEEEDNGWSCPCFSPQLNSRQR